MYYNTVTKTMKLSPMEWACTLSCIRNNATASAEDAISIRERASSTMQNMPKRKVRRHISQSTVSQDDTKIIAIREDSGMKVGVKGKTMVNSVGRNVNNTILWKNVQHCPSSSDSFFLSSHCVPNNANKQSYILWL